MKSTGEFKNTIQQYLEQRAASDSLFAESFSKDGKNIDDCITYILNTVQKSGCNGFTDEEIFSMAVHYYDEDKIEIGKPITCNVVVNHSVELTEEEKAEARKGAIKQYQSEYISSFKKKKKTTEKAAIEQPSLFD